MKAGLILVPIPKKNAMKPGTILQAFDNVADWKDVIGQPYIQIVPIQEKLF